MMVRKNVASMLVVAATIGMPFAAYGETPGLNFEVVYAADILRNATGGIDQGSAYIDNLDVTLEIDAEKLWGMDNVELFFYGLYNNGALFSERYVGDAQVVSNIEAGEHAIKLYEAWVNVDFGSRSDLRFGLYDLNSEFDVLDSSALFIGSAHGIGTEISQTGVSGPSIFPSTSLSLRLATQLNESWRLQFAALDAVPGDPDHTHRTTIRLSSEEGALLIAEAQRVAPKSRLLLGAWAYTSKTDVLSPQPTGAQRRTNSGAYVRGEAVVSDAIGELTAFGRVGIADDQVNLFSSFYSGGLNWKSFSEARPDDEMGIAFALAKASGDAPVGLEEHEIAFELTYRMQLGDRFAVQPNIQYVVNPGLDPALDNALVVGARFEVQVF